MTEFLLQTDPLEFQNTRQSTKINFLQQEVQQLQEHIQDLEQVVRINKEALKISTSQQSQALLKLKSASHNDTTASTIDITLSKENVKSLQLLVDQLQEENTKLLDIIEKVRKERNIAQSKSLISEQICEESQRHGVEALEELEEKIHDLRKLLQDKEYAIQELEKIKPLPEQEGVVIKYREVLAPSEQNLKLHNEMDSLHGMLAKVSKELNKVQVEKQELATINFSLASELSKIRATFSSPMNFPMKFGALMNKGGDLNYSDGDILDFIPPQMVIMNENDDDESPFPDRVVTNHESNNKKVPKLDLAKAKKIQENIVSKLNPPAAQPHGVDPKAAEKIRNLEKELELLRKRLSYEMINNRLVSEEANNLKRERMQLMATNEILIKSNKRYEEKSQKVFYTLEFYKEYYHKYLDLVTKKHSAHVKTTSTFLPNYEKFKQISDKLMIDIDSSPQIKKPAAAEEEDDGKQVNVSFLEGGKEEIEEEDRQHHAPNNQENKDNVYDFSKEQCKFFLLNLARDLYVNSNIHGSTFTKNILRKLEFGKKNPSIKPVLRLKRSVSNPLDYVSERRKLIFDARVENKDKNATRLRKQKNARLADDQNEDLMRNQNVGGLIEGFQGQVGLQKELESPITKNFPGLGNGQDEMMSFSVDADEFGKQKMADVSFISNNEILDQIKHN
jgi:hypothetical protein